MTQTLQFTFDDSNETFSVRRYSVRERLSHPFDLEIVALAANDDVDLETLVGGEVKFAVVDSSDPNRKRVYRGLCMHAEQVATDADVESTYVFFVVPRLALLGHRTDYRIFQHKTVVEIVKTILEAWNIEHDWRVDNSRYPELEYRVQYGETDLGFVSRLLEDSGVSYYLEDDGNVTKLVLDDTPNDRTARADALPFSADPTQAARTEFITNVHVGHGLHRGRFRLRDFDFRRPASFDLTGEAGDGSALEQRLELYRYEIGSFVTEGHQAHNTPVADAQGVARADIDYGKRLAQERLQRSRGTRRHVAFETTAIDLFAGVVFTIAGHPRADLSSDKKLLITEVVTEGSFDAGWRARGRAVFADQPYRPARSSPVPRVRGVDSAIVVGPAGDEIHTDEHGRIRVQFHWDRQGARDEHSSCWLRVSQAWAGGGYGIIALPRVGHEVLVDYLGGHPDQPIVVGRVFSTTQPVPHTLPDNQTVSCWRTRSTPNSDGFNELRFEDKAGGEEIYVHAERDLREEVGHNHRLRVRNTESISIGSSQTIGVGSDQSVTVGARRFEKIGKGDDLMVAEGDKAIEVANGDYTVTCENGKIELRNGIAHINMLDDRIELHTGRGAAIVLQGNAISLVATTIELTATDDVTVDAGHNVVVNAVTEVDVHGGVIKLNC